MANLWVVLEIRGAKQWRKSADFSESRRGSCSKYHAILSGLLPAVALVYICYGQWVTRFHSHSIVKVSVVSSSTFLSIGRHSHVFNLVSSESRSPANINLITHRTSCNHAPSFPFSRLFYWSCCRRFYQVGFSSFTSLLAQISCGRVDVVWSNRCS